MTVMKTKFVWLSAVALWAIPAIASAHAGNDDPNVVHACIGNVSRVVRVVGVSGACIAAPSLIAEAPAHWAIKGKDGTNGIDGTSVTFVDYFSGSAGGCSNGGAIYAAGNPPVNTYVCNGINGIDGEDGAAGTRADGPCFDNNNRYVDCGNGTVTDTVTGLIWLKQWNCLPNGTWAAANQAAAGLKSGDCSLTDNSSAGDWRLPTMDEWNATLARAFDLGCTGTNGPSLTNDVGNTCYGTGVGSSFVGVYRSQVYWAATGAEGLTNFAADASFESGGVLFTPKSNASIQVWPVRGGPR